MGIRKLLCGIGALLAVAGLAAGCAVNRGSDGKITANVQSLINQHTDIGTEVNVQTVDRVVYLSGYVSQGEMRSTAESVAASAPGVTRVVNTIAVTK